jgi:sortase A
MMRAEGSQGVKISLDLSGIDSRALVRAGVRAVIVTVVMFLLFTAFLFGASNLEQARSQATLLAEFSAVLPTGTIGTLDAPVALGGPVALIEVPSLGLRQVVVEGSSPDALKQGPGHLPISSMPGEVGSSVLFGRRAGYGGPFRSIAALQQGDEIVVTTGQGVFVYDVTATTPVPRDQTQFYQPTAESTMTLVTSSSLSPWSDRIAVTSELQGDPVGIPTRPIATIGESALGTSGDPLGFPLALFWGGLLFVTVAISTRLYRRWSSLAAYLMTAPVLLLLLWFTFESLVRVLPGTL